MVNNGEMNKNNRSSPARWTLRNGSSFKAGVGGGLTLLLALYLIYKSCLLLGILIGTFQIVLAEVLLYLYLLKRSKGRLESLVQKKESERYRLLRAHNKLNLLYTNQYEGFLHISVDEKCMDDVGGGGGGSREWWRGRIFNDILIYENIQKTKKSLISLNGAKLEPAEIYRRGRFCRRKFFSVMNPEKVLFQENNRFYLFAKNFKEMEEWYLAIKFAIESKNSFSKGHSLFEDMLGLKGLDFSPKCLEGMLASKNSSLWLNLFVHRVFRIFFSDENFVEMINAKIRSKLAKLNRPSFVRCITLHKLNLGSYFPIFSNLNVASVRSDGLLNLDCDIYYSGNAKIELNLHLAFEIFGKKFSVRIILKIIIKRIKGKIQIAFSQVPSAILWISFHEEPEIEIETRHKFGANTRFINIPKITKILVFKIRQEMMKTLILPEMDDWPLPKFKSNAKDSKKPIRQERRHLRKRHKPLHRTTSLPSLIKK